MVIHIRYLHSCRTPHNYLDIMKLDSLFLLIQYTIHSRVVVTVIRVHLSTTLLFLDIGRPHIVGVRHRSRPNC